MWFGLVSAIYRYLGSFGVVIGTSEGMAIEWLRLRSSLAAFSRISSGSQNHKFDDGFGDISYTIRETNRNMGAPKPKTLNTKTLLVSIQASILLGGSAGLSK